MLRRNFINMRGAVAASAVVEAERLRDPERLLWIPGKKRIFIPPSRFEDYPQVFVNGVLQVRNRDYWAAGEGTLITFARVPNEPEMVVTIRHTDVAWDWRGDFSRGLPID